MAISDAPTSTPHATIEADVAVQEPRAPANRPVRDRRVVHRRVAPVIMGRERARLERYGAVPENTFPLTAVPTAAPIALSVAAPSSVPAPASTADAIAHELAVLIDAHLAELRARGVSEEVLAPLVSELQRYHDHRLAS